MFPNTVTVADEFSAHVLSIIDTDNGSTTRSKSLGGGNSVSLTIARTESTENKGILSDRILVRADEVVIDPNPPYAPTRVSFYGVLVVPRRPDITGVIAQNAVLRVVNFLMGYENPADLVDAATLRANVARLMSGET